MRAGAAAALVALAALPALGAGPLPERLESPRLVVLKARRQLQLFSAGALLKTYPIALGSEPVAPKRREGDRATPEGKYRVCLKNPRSRFTLSLGLDYPNAADAALALAQRRISRRQHDAIVAAVRRGACPPWGTPLGGEIFVHGGGTASDWTWGCVALDDADIRELFRLVPVGTAVEIEP